jgi:predicted transcriptional regulator
MLKMVQNDLARKASLSQRSLAVIETGGAKPRAATLEKLRAVLEQEGIAFFDSEEGRGVMLKGDA